LGFSRQTPDAAADVKQQSGIAQDLQLLADFVADVAINGCSAIEFANSLDVD